MNLQVSHPARSRLCLADGGHWLGEEAATVYGHRVTFSVRSHFPGPPWLRRFRLFSGSGLPVRSLRIWPAGPVPADLACPVRSLRIWPARSGPCGSGLPNAVPADLACPMRSLRIWPARSGPSGSGLPDAVRDSRTRGDVPPGSAEAEVPAGTGTSPLPAGRPRRGATDQAAEVLTALLPAD